MIIFINSTGLNVSFNIKNSGNKKIILEVELRNKRKTARKYC